ncbi:MAG: hypothetical protein QW172_05490 [Candidatus Bathyarchaeia archaeon]
MKSSLENPSGDHEGLNPLYKLSALSLLAYANRWPSMKVQKTAPTLRRSITSFEASASKALSKAECLPFDELICRRILKRKHYHYGAYLAVVSSFPILSKVMGEKIEAPVVAKTSEISSIKALDNLNDEHHRDERAVKTMEIQRQAFLNPHFRLPNANTTLSKAENSTYALAGITCQILSSHVDPNSTTYKIFQADMDRYFKGQMESMRQKVYGKAGERSKIGIKEFLLNVNEKGVGRIWIDVDFCFLEAFHDLEEGEYRAMESVRKAIDLIFKGCNIYDDVADFKVDISHNIWNSVAYLALDRGHCDENDLTQPTENASKILERSGVFDEAVQLGDLIFLKGVEKLEEARDCTNLIDVDALIFNAYLLRLFAIRKWLIEAKSPLKLVKVLKPTVSDQILPYNRYII